MHEADRLKPAAPQVTPPSGVGFLFSVAMYIIRQAHSSIIDKSGRM